MSNYVISTNFATKDSLPLNDPLKIVKGTEINTEFNNIATAVGTKADLVSPTFTGTPLAPTASPSNNSTQIATTAYTDAAIAAVPASAPEFPSGTVMLFVQTAAPTGWTKSTTHNDKALRVVSGTVTSGGTTAFSSVFANQTPTITLSGLSAGATTLSTTQIPSHVHFLTTGPYGNGSGGASFYPVGSPGSPLNTGATGGGGSHTHTVSGSGSSSAVTLNVAYVDVIIATKN